MIRTTVYGLGPFRHQRIFGTAAILTRRVKVFRLVVVFFSSGRSV